MTTTFYPNACRCHLRYEKGQMSIIKACDEHKGWTIEAILEDIRIRDERMLAEQEANGEEV